MSETAVKMKESIELSQQLVAFEGLRTKVYTCPAGKLTIGVGRNLEARGISKQEAFYLLDNDIASCKKACSRSIPAFKFLSPQRQNVLIDMAFNLGSIGLLGFSKMITCLSKGNFVGASQEMLDSKWAKQVGNRAVKLSKMMAEDKWFSEV